jgi:hypothetical protein
MTPIDSLPEDEWLALVRQALEMRDPPPQWVDAALALWARQGPRSDAVPGLRRWLAALRFDSWTAPLALSSLRLLSSTSRQLLFVAEGRDIDVRIAPQADDFEIRGQQLGPDAAGHVELVLLSEQGSAGMRRRADLDQHGEFGFEGLSQGTYQMILRLGGDEFLLPPIDIGAPPTAPAE